MRSRFEHERHLQHLAMVPWGMNYASGSSSSSSSSSSYSMSSTGRSSSSSGSSSSGSSGSSSGSSSSSSSSYSPTRVAATDGGESPATDDEGSTVSWQGSTGDDEGSWEHSSVHFTGE
jgi:hypothetical protein